MAAMSPDIPSTAAPDPRTDTATSVDVPVRRIPALSRLRRLEWVTTVGLALALGGFVVVAILVTEPFGPLAVATALGAGTASVASAGLLAGRTSADTTIHATGVDRPGDQSTPDTAAAQDRPSPGGGHRRIVAVVVAVAGALVVVMAAPWFAGDPTWSLVPGLVVGATAATARRGGRTAVVVAGTVVTAAVAVVAGLVAPGGLDSGRLVADSALVAVIGGGLVAASWSSAVVERLEQARQVEGELAVAEERLRFAADLHDVQGHHLQVITLTSELAARLIDTDPAAAADHMRTVNEHARTALEDTRALVAGYRRTTLATELSNATRVLAAAGIDARLDPGTDRAARDVGQPVGHLLGLVVRETTTNMLRHSHAARARFTLDVDDGRAWLEVANDSAGDDLVTGRASSDATTGSGSGLASLRRRLEDVGGTVDWHRGDRAFTVTAVLPVTVGASG